MKGKTRKRHRKEEGKNDSWLRAHIDAGDGLIRNEKW